MCQQKALVEELYTAEGCWKDSDWAHEEYSITVGEENQRCLGRFSNIKNLGLKLNNIIN